VTQYSVFDLFKVGIGPSSSHTVGPMRAALTCVQDLRAAGKLGQVRGVRVRLLGSLGATGLGHGTDNAVYLGLSGLDPETVTTEDIERVKAKVAGGSLKFGGEFDIALTDQSMSFEPQVHLRHPNALTIEITDAQGQALLERTYYSVGGGFIVPDAANEAADIACGCPSTSTGCESAAREVPYPFEHSSELLERCEETGMSVAGVMMANERALNPELDVEAKIGQIWDVMVESIKSGLNTEGVLPGGMALKRRAPQLYRSLRAAGHGSDPFRMMDWITVYALAVSEENAAGHRVVTAPTNGAAAVVPAVLRYYTRHTEGGENISISDFFLAAGAIGLLIKRNASLAGAEVGCQGEIGSACAMAAGGLVQALGGTPGQVENAAEIAMEHHLGLTCDPVNGLVQIPCIERNAISAVTAVNSARMAMRGDGRHRVSLDAVLKTMLETGLDMKRKYKETALGGLAANFTVC
jgi:L-serine dehydratase